MHPQPLQDRRSLERFECRDMAACLRLKGQLGRTTVEVIDFNRHGIAIRCRRPLPKDTLVYLSLSAGAPGLDRVVGVVHNCLGVDEGYRCGIRFRTRSNLQFDRELVESRLEELEAALAGRSRGPTDRPGLSLRP